MSTSRREFLQTTWKAGLALLGVAATWTTYEALRPFSARAAGTKIKVGNAQNFPVGSATYFPEGRLYMTNAQNQYFALSQKCPHLGCRIPYCESSGRFECACHGSIFNLAGEYQAGPSPRGMDRYALAAEGNLLVVDTNKLEPGPDQGTHQFHIPPKGPSCQGA
jgi:cytochrome b6-f complex iron-sulfur subunit